MNQIVKVSANDRLSFTVFMAVIFHALIILGVGFTVQDKPVPPPSLEITLEVYKSKDKHQEAGYLAKLNQHGSGYQDEKYLPAINKRASFQDNGIRDRQQILHLPLHQKGSTPNQKHTTAVVTLSVSKNKSADVAKPKMDPFFSDRRPEVKLIDVQKKIAILEELFKKERQAYAKRPRIRRLTAASTVQEVGADYKEKWRRKVEKIGNINYPEKARQDKLYGELSIMVAINKDGTLHDIEIVQSSGVSVLDDAAVRTIRLSAPFLPFDDDLKDYDLLEITRTWRFEPGDQLSSN
ncbi:MAG: TonB family protein [Candidatus Endonucleobacter bathymodioli]|uniref:TonB family protein n=1 Tax=Candidatus Endonucleibacter bathymodioli TaxID=539814 RepID=A0AA90NPG0_9GAMM|nr:TonB family protein [Candidatus Endonucleobacter bathymodioli]